MRVKQNPIRVGFSWEPVRNRSIEKRIDRSLFETRYLDPREPGALTDLDLFIPLTLQDIVFLAESHMGLSPTRYIVPHPEVVELATEKPRFNAWMRANGFGSFVPKDLAPLQFPYVVKKNRDAGGLNSHLILNRKMEMEFWHLIHDSAYHCQPFVPGDREYTTHLLFAGGIHYELTLEFSMNRRFYIRGARMKPFRNVQIRAVPSRFGGLFADILKAMKFTGLCCFNFKIVDSSPVIFEMNPRFGGSLVHDINRAMGHVLRLVQAVDTNSVAGRSIRSSNLAAPRIPA